MVSQGKSTNKIVIIGAGIIGVCCALSLQERGFSVHLVDKLQPGEATSYGNAGVISPWSCVPQCMPGIWRQVPKWLLDPLGPVRLDWRNLLPAIPWSLQFFANSRPGKLKSISDAMDVLMKDNVNGYKKYLHGTGKENLLHDSWYVNVFRGPSRPNIKDLTWQLRLDHGAPIEFADAGQLNEIEPAISDEYHSAVILKDQARAFAPGKLCKALAEKAFKQGARFTQTEVKKIQPTDNDFVLESSNENIKAENVVVCGGIWSKQLLEPLGIKLPLMAERGYHLEFTHPGVELVNSVLDSEAKIVVSSMENGIRSAGTSEIAKVDSPPNYQRAEILKTLTKRLLPDLNTDETQRWMGNRPSFPDNLPVIDQAPGFKGLFGAFGHSHYGLGMAPNTGKLLTDMVAKASTNWDLKPYRFDRF